MRFGRNIFHARTQDSLGGNSKTVMIANISPSTHNITETQSTLRFAQRAKKMGNRAVVNENAAGDVDALRREVLRLKQELALQQRGAPRRAVISAPACPAVRSLPSPTRRHPIVGCRKRRRRVAVAAGRYADAELLLTGAWTGQRIVAQCRLPKRFLHCGAGACCGARAAR